MSRELVFSVAWGAMISVVTLMGLTMGVKILFFLNSDEKLPHMKRRWLLLLAVLLLVGQFLLSGLGLHYAIKNGFDSFGIAGGMIGGILLGFAVVKFFEPPQNDENP